AHQIPGRWTLSGKSMPYISAAFNHLERLNDARIPFRDITEEPINALGMVGWTPSSEPTQVPEKKPVATFKRPVAVVLDDEVPPSPREPMPHRSAGYGPAHQKRKLRIPDRSRSVSPMGAESPLQSYDKYAKYERNRTVYPHKEELTVMTRETRKSNVPYRSGGYGAYHEKRQYDLSPRSIGSAGYSSGG
ncbi:Pharyngeal MARGginal cell marker, partial [Trichostrongylus colubriformis]